MITVNDILSMLFGLVGGMIPGGLRLAWTLRRGATVDAGTIDLTAYKTKQP